jgi:hypothetical protein
MPKYINADALTAELNDMDGMIYRDLADILAAVPSADVAPVRRGRWEITDAYPHWMCCSVCHKAVVRNIEVIERYEIPTSFCPNCGALMEDKP